MVTIKINKKKYQADEGETVLPVLIREGIDIPYLCYHEALSPYGSCRLCMVEVTGGGRKGITASCTLPVSEGLEIETESPEVVNVRTILLEMYLAEAPGSKKIQELAKKFGVVKSRFANFDIEAKGDRCVLCGLCVRVCNDLLGIGAINYAGRGTNPISIPLGTEVQTRVSDAEPVLIYARQMRLILWIAMAKESWKRGTERR